MLKKKLLEYTRIFFEEVLRVNGKLLPRGFVHLNEIKLQPLSLERTVYLDMCNSYC